MEIQRFYIDTKRPIPISVKHQLMNAFPEAEEKNLGDNSGDILIQIPGKTIIAEIKSVPGDFLNSVTDNGRIFKQCEGIRKITPWAFLILSNDFDYDTQKFVRGMRAEGYGRLGTWHRNHIEGILTSIRARGVIDRVAYDGYVDAIRRIINWVADADRGTVTSEPIKLSPFDKDSQETVNLLAWFDDIGVIQAKNFLEWVRVKHGNLPRHRILELVLTEFEGKDKPTGWTNYTIKKNRAKMQYPEPKKEEWKEEALDD